MLPYTSSQYSYESIPESNLSRINPNEQEKTLKLFLLRTLQRKRYFKNNCHIFLEIEWLINPVHSYTQESSASF